MYTNYLINHKKSFLLPGTSFRVKDGSGALYCFGPKAKTIKAGTNSLTLAVTPKIKERQRISGRGIGLNSVPSARFGIGDKKACLACENFIILQSNFIM